MGSSLRLALLPAGLADNGERGFKCNGTDDLADGDNGQDHGIQMDADFRELFFRELRQADGNPCLGDIGHPGIPVKHRGIMAERPRKPAAGKQPDYPDPDDANRQRPAQGQ